MSRIQFMTCDCCLPHGTERKSADGKYIFWWVTFHITTLTLTTLFSLHPNPNHNPNANPDPNLNSAVAVKCLEIKGREMKFREVRCPISIFLSLSRTEASCLIALSIPNY